MHWADKIADYIVKAGKYEPYHIDDMWTPSGFAHAGSLRGPLIHDIIFRALQDAGVKTTYTFVFNDFDPIDGLPVELKKDFTQYLGFPLRVAPSPGKGFKSFAEYFAKDFQDVLGGLGVTPQFLSSWDMYHEGKFNEIIREALDNADKIQGIYLRVSGSKKREKGWLPLQVICEKCGKLGTTRVYEWDGEKVAYVCEPDLVSWAKGCGHKGRISPFDGNGKLPWKVDWPAHWKVMGVRIEGAGKDHASAGGSWDIARALCKEVFKYPEPFGFPYEFFLLGGKKMGSSKGVGVHARDLWRMLPRPLIRFLFARTDYRQTIEFNPVGTMVIPDLFDEYDRAWQAYVNGSDEDLARSFVLAQVDKVPDKEAVSFTPRFRDVVNYMQFPDIDLQKKFEEIKGGLLTFEELKLLKEREKYARVWIGKYAPPEYQMQMAEALPKEASSLNEKQRQFLQVAIDLIEKEKSPDSLQLALYNAAKELGIGSKEAFSSIYMVLTGKDHGPRAAWFLLQYPKEKVVERLKQAVGVAL